MKLKAVLAVTAALSFGGAFAQANFSDVPAGHWAKDAVDRMAEKGCIIGFPDGTFRGNESLTRYQAALILARCLQEVSDKTVTTTFTDEDVEALRNAIQELSSELAALGVRIADVEDNAATKEDLAALEERIAALEDAEPVTVDENGEPVELPEGLVLTEDLEVAVADLQAQIDELVAAQDEDAARADELQAQLDDLLAQFDDVNASLEENGAAIEEINARIEDLAAALDEVVAASDELTIRVEDLEGGFEGNTASIVALQDLTVLLNEDIVGLEDRISALESDKADAEDVDARFTNLNRDLTDLTNRVTVVETNLSDLQGRFNTLNGTFGFTVGGTLDSRYYVSRVTGLNFDIDRIIPGTKFSSGVDDKPDSETADRPLDYADFGGEKVKVDTLNGFATTDADNGSRAGNTTTTLTLNLGFGNRGLSGSSTTSAGMASATNGLNVHSVVAEFGLSTGNISGVVVGNGSDTEDFATPLAFRVKGVTTVFDVNGAPITFRIGENLKTKFTDFVFDNNDNFQGFGDGFLATIDGSTLPGLGALNPKITVAYGTRVSYGPDNLVPDASPLSASYNQAYNSAVRATISPLTNVTLGLNAARTGTDVLDTSPATTTVFGADLTAVLGGFNIKSEYATEHKEGYGAVDADNSVFYVHADGVAGPVALRGDFWGIDPDFRGASFDAVDDKYTVPFGDVQRRGTTGGFAEAKASFGGFGVRAYFDRNALYTDANTNLSQFGVSASGSVSIINLGAYFDSLQANNFTVSGTALNDASRVGVTAGVKLAGFDVNAYYQSVTANGATVDKLPGVNKDNGAAFKAVAPFDADQVTKAGVDVTGALGIVNVKAGFKVDAGEVAYGPADFDRTTLYAGADATLTAGILTLKPSAEFRNVVDTDAGTDDTSMFRAGLSASTAVLDAVFRPSFTGNVSYYQNNHTDAATYTATELSYSVGVKLDEFLFEKSTFAVRYAGWQGTNRAYTPFSGDTAGKFEDVNGAGDTSLQGIYTEWDYRDINFAFGDFTLRSGGTVNNGQAFKISYRVKF